MSNNTNTNTNPNTNTNTNFNPMNMNNTSEYVNQLYDKMTYLDMYGSTVILFILFTTFIFFIYTYFQAMQKREDIVRDWTNQRCNPKYIPFAGFINAPDGKSSFEFTGENFQYCSQSIFVNIFGNVLKPIELMLSGLTNFFKTMQTSLNQIRGVLSTLRDNISTFVNELLNKVFIVLIPLQAILIKIMDLLNKIKGVTMTTLYSMLGAYMTLKSLLGAMMELVIKVLVIMTVIIVGLWAAGPMMWPAAAASSAAYLGISIPLAIVLYFLSDVLHIKTSSIPKLRRCFDKNTSIKMFDGTFKKIKDICVGDLLENGIKVTSKFKVDASSLKMFRLNNIIVSETHVVKYNGKWIQVIEHPDAFELFSDVYKEPFLYCLNTSSKEITINGTTFSDWDELYDNELKKVLHFISFNNEVLNPNDRENIHQFLEKGLEYDTNVYLADNSKKCIKYIKVGDKLSTNGTVYGIVEILNPDKKSSHTKLYHLLVTNKCFETDQKIIRDYNDAIDSICLITKNN